MKVILVLILNLISFSLFSQVKDVDASPCMKDAKRHQARLEYLMNKDKTENLKNENGKSKVLKSDNGRFEFGKQHSKDLEFKASKECLNFLKQEENSRNKIFDFIVKKCEEEIHRFCRTASFGNFEKVICLKRFVEVNRSAFSSECIAPLSNHDARIPDKNMIKELNKPRISITPEPPHSW